MADGEIQLTGDDGEELLVGDDGEQALADDCCCEDCDCPVGLNWCYGIADYTDGDLEACGGCTPDGFSPGWLGWFMTPTDCVWPGDPGFAQSIDGKALDRDATRLYLDGCTWTVEVWCQSDTLIWSGEKAFDAGDPEGTYDRTGGCDATSSLEIEACPF